MTLIRWVLKSQEKASETMAAIIRARLSWANRSSSLSVFSSLRSRDELAGGKKNQHREHDDGDFKRQHGRLE
jgi:hypothetical protein